MMQQMQTFSLPIRILSFILICCGSVSVIVQVVRFWSE